MPLETATFINNLVASNPASTDTVSQADDHIRLIKQVLKTTFPNLNAPVTATPAQLNSAVPTGFIGMWSGSLATIPLGWGLCDGSAGRPDLRDRFIVGAGNTYIIGTTGGANTVVLAESNIPSHNHTFSGSGSASSAGAHNHTLSDPSHSHVYNRYLSGSIEGFSIAASGNAGTNVTTGSSTTGITIAGVGDHSHSITVSGVVGSTGGGVAHENRPPYYALAFIIKL